MNLFSLAMRQNFEKKALSHLKERFPEQVMNISDEILLDRIRNGIKAAEKYFIHDRKSVMTYLEYVIYFGDNFDSRLNNEWVSRCLCLRSSHGSEKINCLLENVPL